MCNNRVNIVTTGTIIPAHFWNIKASVQGCLYACSANVLAPGHQQPSHTWSLLQSDRSHSSLMKHTTALVFNFTGGWCFCKPDIPVVLILFRSQLVKCSLRDWLGIRQSRRDNLKYTDKHSAMVNSWDRFNTKTVFPGIGIAIIKIRRSRPSYLYNGYPIMMHPYTEMAPWLFQSAIIKTWHHIVAIRHLYMEIPPRFWGHRRYLLWMITSQIYLSDIVSRVL